jgi:hypothetical protein
MKGIVVAFIVRRTVFRADWLKIGKELETSDPTNDLRSGGRRLQRSPENICRTNSK